jgi:hypothetical protein
MNDGYNCTCIHKTTRTYLIIKNLRPLRHTSFISTTHLLLLISANLGRTFQTLSFCIFQEQPQLHGFQKLQ